MKKKLLIAAVLVLSIALGFSIGVLAFSGDNLQNITSKRSFARYETDKGLALEGFDYSDGKYSSTENSLMRIDNVYSYVSNLRLILKPETELTAVKVYYTESAEEAFSDSKSMICGIEKKNGDFYISIDRDVYSIALGFAAEEDFSGSISAVETNPVKLNFNTVNLVLLTVLPAIGGCSVISILSDKESFIKDLAAMKRYKYLLYDLVTKDIKTKYRRSVLGVLWSVLNPLLMMLVLTAVFANIIRIEVKGGFALFYLTGYIMFNFLSESTGFSLTTITSAAPLIKKVYIPKYVFPLEKCIFSFVNMLFSLVAFVIVFTVFCFTGSMTPSFAMLLFPLPMIYIFIFSLGLSLTLSSLMVFFRDIGHIWGILLTVWMYASPIIYPIDRVPDWLAGIIRINPLYHYIDYFRNVMLYGCVPGLYENGICLLYSVAILLLGVAIFKKSQDKFILHI